MATEIYIPLDLHSERFIQKELQTGRYASADDLVQAGLRLLEKGEKLSVLRQALIDGEQSGWAHDFDPEEFKARMRGKKIRKWDHTV